MRATSFRRTFLPLPAFGVEKTESPSPWIPSRWMSTLPTLSTRIPARPVAGNCSRPEPPPSTCCLLPAARPRL